MKIIEKKGNELKILALPNEAVRVGDYLRIDDPVQGGSLIAQVYDESYLNSQSLIDDMIKDELIGSLADGESIDPMNIRGLAHLMKDCRLLSCKIRGSLKGGVFTLNASWLPLRTYARIRVLTLSELFSGMKGRRIELGEGSDGMPFWIPAEGIDGSLSIITGKKGSGKSHLAKMIISKLVEYGAPVVVFDLNDEYLGLAWSRDGRPSEIAERVFRLEPGRNLKFNLNYLGPRAIISVLRNSLDCPGITLREFSRLIQSLRSEGRLSLKELGNEIRRVRCNEAVMDAMTSRYLAMLSSGLFTDEEGVRLEELIDRDEGSCLVVSLAKVKPLARRMVVELLLNKLVELLEAGAIRPLFLFAEEAHLYIRDTYWDDVITRMRHFGIFTTFITNQPDALKGSVYRQADNFFIFNFTNSSDLELLSKAISFDEESLKSMVSTLPKGSCLIVGKVVNGLPVLVKVSESKLLTLGRTRLCFAD